MIKFKLATLLVIMSILTTSCATSRVVEAEMQPIPYGFSIVESDFNGSLKTLMHEKTGCYYVYAVYDGKAVTQMFIEKNGVSVPYCLKVGG